MTVDAQIVLCHRGRLFYFIYQCLVRWDRADCIFWQIRRESPTSIIDKFSEHAVNSNAIYAGEATLYLL